MQRFPLHIYKRKRGAPREAPKNKRYENPFPPHMSDGFSMDDIVLLVGNSGSFMTKIDGGMFHMRSPRGALDTGKLLGRSPGDTVKIGSVEFTLLRPDILDHLENLDRGAQIILPKDSSRMVLELGLSPGSRVVEGGAGSGALSMAILNAISPDGELVTYDIRKDHLERTAGNVERAGLSGIWKGVVGDVCIDVRERGVDAFVVDIPNPELAVDAAASSLRAGGRFCSYVPTFNQMERAAGALRRKGFRNVGGFELLERGFSIKEGATRPVTEILAHTGFIVRARWMGSP